MTGLVGCLLLNGCGGDDGPVRIPMEGVVISNDIGGELKGTIAFLPSGDTKGPAANGLVLNGLYKFTKDDGPVAGEHRVLIDLQPPRGKLEDTSTQPALQWKFEFQSNVPSEAPFEEIFQLVREKTDEPAD